jgi:hypothetical protein
VLFLKTTVMASPTTALITGPSMPRVSSHALALGAHEVGGGMRVVKLALVYPR